MNCRYASTPHTPITPQSQYILKPLPKSCFSGSGVQTQISGNTFQFPGRANFPQFFHHTCLTSASQISVVCIQSQVSRIPDKIHSQVFQDTSTGELAGQFWQQCVYASDGQVIACRIPSPYWCHIQTPLAKYSGLGLGVAIGKKEKSSIVRLWNLWIL